MYYAAIFIKQCNVYLLALKNFVHRIGGYKVFKAFYTLAVFGYNGVFCAPFKI